MRFVKISVAYGKNQKDDEQCVTCSNMRGSPTSIKERSNEWVSEWVGERERGKITSHTVYFEKTNPLRWNFFFCPENDLMRRLLLFFFLLLPAISSDENSIFDFWNFPPLSIPLQSVGSACSVVVVVSVVFPLNNFICWSCRHLFSLYICNN